MRGLSVIHAGAAVAMLLAALMPVAAQAPARTYSVELDAEKDYFAPGSVKVLAVSRAGETELGALDVTIRRRREISVPAGTRELIFRIDKISARLKPPAGNGTIVVRPLSNRGSSSGIAWMFGHRGGIAVDRLVVEFRAD